MFTPEKAPKLRIMTSAPHSFRVKSEQMNKYQAIIPGVAAFPHGGDYNPDQWMDRYPDIIDEDIRLMGLAGCNTFSVGIFSWGRYEPREGEFQFAWMRSILDRLHAAGMQAILATPSGAKPAWMSRAYPEVCRVDLAGQRAHHHHRHNHCFTSPVYREKVAVMNRKLAEEFGSHPAVKLWHVSNEYSGDCHCALCQQAFRDWLKARYGTLQELNHAWWSNFWSHTISSWEEIDSRNLTMEGLRLDWLRFVTAQTVDFMKHEIAVLRECGAKQPVFTNLMGVLPGIDYWRFAEVVDVIADDCYPVWIYEDEADRRTASRVAMIHDMHRSMKGGQPWLLMESCPDSPQHFQTPKPKRPNVYRTEMLQAVAHGSDSVLYFQWRKGRGGMEKFHGAVVDHEGTEQTRVFKQVAELGATLRKLTDVIGTTSRPDVAVLHDWEVRWALEISLSTKRLSYLEGVLEAHRPFWQAGVSTDVIESTCALESYKLVVAPHLYMLKPGVAEHLRQFVEQGGTLVLTCLSGVVTESNLCQLGGLPGGGLRELCGVWVEEVDYLYEGQSQQVSLCKGNSLGLGGGYQTGRICEVIHAEGAEVLATVTTDYYAGHPVLTRNKLGKGSVFYLGAFLGEDFQEAFTDALIQDCGITPILPVKPPRGVGLQMRTDGGAEFVFLQNFTKQPRRVALDDRDYRCMECRELLSEWVDLAPWQTRVLKRACLASGAQP